MNLEHAIVAISVLCFASAIYLAILSTQTVDIEFKKQLVDLAIYCLVGGIVILACWLITQIIKKIFSKEERILTQQSILNPTLSL